MWIDQRTHFHHRGAGADVIEEFTMSFPVFPPPADIGNEHTSAHNICERSAGLLQRSVNVSNTLLGLLIAIVQTHDFALLVNGCRSGDVYPSTDTHCSAVADNVLPFGAGRNILTIQ